MPGHIQMKNILVTAIRRDDHKTVAEVFYENINEPNYCRLYKAILEKENEWVIRSLVVYDMHKEKFLTVGSLYPPLLYEEIKDKILDTLGHNTEFEQQMAQ